MESNYVIVDSDANLSYPMHSVNKKISDLTTDEAIKELLYTMKEMNHKLSVITKCVSNMDNVVKNRDSHLYKKLDAINEQIFHCQ